MTDGVEVELRPIEDEVKLLELGLFNMGLAARGQAPINFPPRVINRSVCGYGDTVEEALAEAVAAWGETTWGYEEAQATEESDGSE